MRENPGRDELALVAGRVGDPGPCREGEDAWLPVRSVGFPAQNWSAQASIRPVSKFALSLTRSFHVPFAVSEEAFTV
ncbi:hypothetical protein SUDANB51_05316 [Streptomyces sp. enrichment culture]